MNSRTKWFCVVIVVGLLVWSCSKDKKTTSPEDTTSSAAGTLGQIDLTFQSCSAHVQVTSQGMTMVFSQSGQIPYPEATIAIGEVDQIQVGDTASCAVLLSMDAADNYNCGNYADHEDAIATITFSRLELTSGGLLSGQIEGLAEHFNHPQDDLLSLDIVFSNIPVILY
jgi:hypothetical protein